MCSQCGAKALQSQDENAPCFELRPSPLLFGSDAPSCVVSVSFALGFFSIIACTLMALALRQATPKDAVALFFCYEVPFTPTRVAAIAALLFFVGFSVSAAFLAMHCPMLRFVAAGVVSLVLFGCTLLFYWRMRSRSTALPCERSTRWPH